MTFSNVLCIVGTDTGVGKTVVGASLCALLRSLGLRIGVFKPAESGCQVGDLFEPSDAVLLKTASGCQEPLETIVPYRLCEPLSPAEASRLDGVEISRDLLFQKLSYLSENYDFVLLEGAGGLLVPFTRSWCFADFIESFSPRVVVVGRSTLGTVNHTLLTLAELQRRRIPVSGFILNRLSEHVSIEEASNPSSIRGFTDTPFLGFFPFISPESVLDPETICSIVKENLDTLFLSSLYSRVH